MNNPWISNGLVFVALGFGLIASTAHGMQIKAKDGKRASVTGCLQKGDNFGEYSITGEDGKRYSLRSNTADLPRHVGHKVTATGTKIRDQNEEKGKKEAGGSEYAELPVTDVKMISEVCPYCCDLRPYTADSDAWHRTDPQQLVTVHVRLPIGADVCHATRSRGFERLQMWARWTPHFELDITKHRDAW
jgi:hypothetical protein